MPTINAPVRKSMRDAVKSERVEARAEAPKPAKSEQPVKFKDAVEERKSLMARAKALGIEPGGKTADLRARVEAAEAAGGEAPAVKAGKGKTAAELVEKGSDLAKDSPQPEGSVEPIPGTTSAAFVEPGTSMAGDGAESDED